MFRNEQKAIQLIHVGKKRTAHIVTIKAVGEKLVFCDDVYWILYDAKTGRQHGANTTGGLSELVTLGK